MTDLQRIHSVKPAPVIAAKRILLVNLFLAAFLPGCATVGKDFPSPRVMEIKVGETRQQQIREMFGPPWRIGIEDGKPTWNYGKYRYSAFSPAQTKDLVIRFDNNGTVRSYTFNTTENTD
ncbi:MAG: outer membrane protein assembly factor BamE domain-containing protein [Gammaproteobacteria bacterium]